MSNQAFAIAALGLSLTMVPATQAAPLSVNIDFNNNDFSTDNTYAVDDGVLSNTGGTVWNGIEYDSLANVALLDEFGGASGLTYTPTFTSSFGGGTQNTSNQLLNGGMISAGFTISGLVKNQTYLVAFYLGENSGIYGGIDNNSIFDSAVPSIGSKTFTMPGVANQDYVVLPLIAKDFGGGVVGFKVNEGSLDGLLVGMQIQAPEPASMALLTAGAATMLVRRRRID